MSLLTSITVLPANRGGRGSAPPAPMGQAPTLDAGPPTVRSVQAAAPAGREATVAAARDKLEAAVRSAFLHGLMRGAARISKAATASSATPAPQRPAPPVRDMLLQEIIARVSIQAVRLPVLPEPATPSRDAFAEAVLAMRTGLKRAEGGGLAGRA